MMNSTTINKGKIFAVVIWIGIWQLVSLLINQPLFLPSPIQTIVALLQLGKTADFYFSVGSTLLRVLIGLFSAIILGIAFDLFSTKNHAIQTLFLCCEGMLSNQVSCNQLIPLILYIVMRVIVVLIHHQMPAKRFIVLMK